MKKSKKIISVVLSLILIISVTTTVLIATANAKETSVAITVDKTELSAGQSATVSVKVTSNYPIATMSIPVFYDKTLVTVSDATATLTDYAVKSAITEAQSADTSKIYTNTGIDSDKFGFVLASYIGGAGATVPETTDCVVLTFKITAKENASGIETLKCITQSAKSDENVAGMLYFGSTVSGTTINAIPENVENIDLTYAKANVTISSELNTLMVKPDYADSGIVIDKLFVSVMASDDWYPEFAEAEDAEATGLVYGFDTLCYMSNEDELTLADVLTTAYGDDYLQITTMEDADGWESTGTIIEVLDEDGAVVETYYFVYFGDINGDGAVDSSDVTAAARYNRYGESVETLAQLAAADMNADAFVESSDVTLTVRANRYEEYAVQEELAVDFYACVEEYAAELELV